MRIDQFPRPRGDTGIGFHYHGDLHHYDRQSLNFWLDELRDLGASWLVLPSSLDQPVPEYFLRELIAAHVEPVIRVDVWPIGPVDRSRLLEVCRDYASWGVYYLHVYNEPNLATQWRMEEWAAPGLVERFAAMLFPALEAMHQAGLFPLITPLAPGGHYWDLTFLKQLLASLARDDHEHVLDRLGVCIHNYASNRPLAWGKGGPERWPYVRPYNCPSGSQDHRGFCLFEWYDAIVRDQLGRSLPMICGETGLVPGTQNDASFPVADEMLHGQRSVELARMVMDGDVPDYLLNLAFWALAAGDEDPTETHAWYKRDTSTLPAVGAIKQLKKHPRRFSWDDSANRATTGESTRPIYHYALLQAPGSSPGSPDGPARWLLPAAMEYVAHFRPTVGFSVDEARRASRVTVIGTDPRGVASAEDTLSQAGCLVEGLAVSSENELRAVLGELVQRGRRFRQLPG